MDFHELYKDPFVNCSISASNCAFKIQTTLLILTNAPNTIKNYTCSPSKYSCNPILKTRSSNPYKCTYTP